MQTIPRQLKRRDFLRLAAVGGAAFASALPGFTYARDDDFYFVQLSDAHWGFEGPGVNPDAKGTLPKAIAAVNALPVKPDFVIFTGDLTHTTDDPALRRERLAQVQSMVAKLDAQPLYLMPGEHDASLDNGAAYKERFGATHYTSITKACISSRSTTCRIRRAASARSRSRGLPPISTGSRRDARIVVFTHRPLFDLAPQWDWATRDGSAGHRRADAPPERHRVLRPHPSGTPHDDGQHRASRGALADVSAARGGFAGQEDAGAVGRGRRRIAGSAGGRSKWRRSRARLR